MDGHELAVIWDVHLFTDVMCTGVWEALKELKDPVLKSLAASLKNTVLAGRAPPEVEALG